MKRAWEWTKGALALVGGVLLALLTLRWLYRKPDPVNPWPGREAVQREQEALRAQAEAEAAAEKVKREERDRKTKEAIDAARDVELLDFLNGDRPRPGGKHGTG